jgi:hypothetical protein
LWVQLGSGSSASALRERLSLAAVALLFLPATAMADSGATNQLEYSGLFYGEQSRTQVFEPNVRATRLFGDGQVLSAQLGIDVITGASPSGALPAGSVQTTTTPSGRLVTVPAGSIPLTKFEDRRIGLDGEWQKPWGKLVTSTVGLHASREKDYQSLGLNGKLSAELWNRRVTVTAGGAYSNDSVFPVGGTPIGLSDGSEVSNHANAKRVKSALVGISHILTRRWLVALDGTRTFETGYLTEPYKVISIISPFDGEPTGDTLTDNRPSSRTRSSALVSSVYHLTHDIVYTSYRYYWDTWGVRSNTVDLKYRYDLEDDWYLEPHVRYYHQTAANFFTVGLSELLRPPEYATSDYRLGELSTITIGATFAFRLAGEPSLWTLRAEYIRQAGNSSPPSAVGTERTFDLSPPINTFTAVVGYAFNF